MAKNNKKGLFFWLCISWWWYPIIWCFKLIFLPFTILSNKQKKKKELDNKTIAWIDNDYENRFIPQILKNPTQENIVKVANEFKYFFDKMKMSNKCKSHYMERYETLIKYNTPKAGK